MVSKMAWKVTVALGFAICGRNVDLGENWWQSPALQMRLVYSLSVSMILLGYLVWSNL